MSQPHKHFLKLEWLVPWPKYMDKTLKYCIDNHLEYIKLMHREERIKWDEVAWYYFLKASGREPQKGGRAALSKTGGMR